jgi:glyoxylase-like metal-dependent hydrolase (beta-lactamase superfamily II)
MAIPENATELAENLYQIDTKLGGFNEVTAGYLIIEPVPVLIETGAQSSYKTVVETLKDFNLSPNDLSSVIVTHIHLDHAGAVGDIAKEFPSAKIYVHPKGARHLIDPTRLIQSAQSVYGDFLDSLYGRLTPTESERIVAVQDGQELIIASNRKLTFIDSPGHAKHHIAIFDDLSGIIFCGDAAGVKLPDVGVLRPSTPPADFDLDQALSSLKKFLNYKPHRVALAHYGLIDQEPQELIREATEQLISWAEVATKAWQQNQDIADALTKKFGNELANLDPEKAEKINILNGIHSNAMGLKLWLEKTHKNRATH